MYYVPDDTDQCGYYECKECGSRFLDLKNRSSHCLPLLWGRTRYGNWAR